MNELKELVVKLRNANRALAAGVILSGLGAFGSFWFGNEVSDKKESAANNSISELKGQNEVLRQELDKSRRETKAYTMGTDSKVFFHRISYLDAPLFVDLRPVNHSNFPCYNLWGHYANLDEPDGNGLASIHNFSYPELPAHSTIAPSIRFDLKNAKRLRLNLFLNFRNGWTRQQIRIARVGKKTWFATRIQFSHGDSIFVEPGYPGYDSISPGNLFKDR